MADILKLTTTDAVRATLGATEDEMEDSFLSEFRLEEVIELEVLNTECITETIDEIIANGRPTSASATARKRYLSLSEFARYFCAYTVAQSGQLSMFSKISDGQNELQRATPDVQKVSERLLAEANRHRANLCDTYSTSTSDTSGLFGKASPDYDPVIGE